MPKGVKDIEAFLVGGGGSGRGGSDITGGGGGGGGYTTTAKIDVSQIKSIDIVIGSGGDHSNGGNTSVGITVASGGGDVRVSSNGYRELGGNGGSGGGGGYGSNFNSSSWMGSGGSDGSDGNGGNKGTGQHTTTRAFGESNGTLEAEAEGILRLGLLESQCQEEQVEEAMEDLMDLVMPHIQVLDPLILEVEAVEGQLHFTHSHGFGVHQAVPE